jgi:hypothetical protein
MNYAGRYSPDEFDIRDGLIEIFVHTYYQPMPGKSLWKKALRKF